MISLERFRMLEAALRANGYGSEIQWSETIAPPTSADRYAEDAIYVICNSGMAQAVGRSIYTKCLAAVRRGAKAADVFGHPGKAAAIDRIWREREALFAAYQTADDKVAELRKLPFIGAVTALHLAKNFGIDTAKPDVHMERLARREGTTTQLLCARLAAETGYRVATVDTILWRACADRILNSQRYELEGWDAAFYPND